MLGKARFKAPGLRAPRQTPADRSAVGEKGRDDTEVLPGQGAARPPLASNLLPTAFPNCKARDINSSLNHSCAFEGHAVTHTEL